MSASAVDAIVVSRPLKPSETAQGPVVIEYGKTPFGFATTTPAATGFRSVEELAAVYGGARPAWLDETPIRRVMRPAISGDAKLIASFSPAMKQAVQSALTRPGNIIETAHQDAAAAMDNIPGALGTTTLAALVLEKRRFRRLPFNGVVPSVKALADGSYPFVHTMALVR